MKAVTSGLLAAFFIITAAMAGERDGEARNRILEERDQVASGDYTYQVLWNGTVVPRCDRFANELRRRRPPHTLRFPIPCGEPAARRRNR